MVSGEPGWFDTRAAALWDDENLYVAFWIEEPFVEAHQDRRDSLVFLENDVEVFIDGGDCYYEFEINALGTVYEVFFVWQDAQGRGSRFDVPEFDPLAPGALTFGGDYDRTGEHFWRGTHPRGLRRAFLNWDLAGLRSAVHVDGKLNDRMNVDKGWTMEVAFPWAGMRHLAGGRALPPNPGDQWKLFFGRFERLLAPAAARFSRTRPGAGPRTASTTRTGRSTGRPSSSVRSTSLTFRPEPPPICRRSASGRRR